MGIVKALTLDAVVVAILLISVIYGVKRGFMRSVISLAGNIAALIVALVFSAQFGTYLNNNYVRTPLYNWTVNQLTSDPDKNITSLEEVDLEDLFENKPEFFKDLCKYMNVDIDKINSEFNEARSNGEEQAKSLVINTMVEPISAAVSRVIAFVIIYILALIAVKIIIILSKLMSKIPVIRTFDRLGGGMIGAVIGVLLSFIFVSIVHLSSPYMFKDKPISERREIFEKTHIYKYIYKINPLSLTFGEWFDNE